MADTSNLDTALPTTEAPTVPDIFKWDYMHPKVKKFVNEWDSKYGCQAKVRRAMRTVEVDVDALRTEGALKKDETFIPVRVIDSSIKTEQPKFLKYVKGSPNLVLFKRDDGAEDPSGTGRLQSDFSKGMKYIEWEKWATQAIDSAQLQGLGSVDIEFDPSKTLNVAINYVPYEDCIFSCQMRDVQQQPYIVIRYPVTLSKLEELSAAGQFNTQVVDVIREKQKDKETETVNIYKKYCKYQGVVYVSWFVLDHDTSGWLKDPQKLYLGIDKEVQTMVDVPVMIDNPLTGIPYQTTTKQPQTSYEPEDITQYPIEVLQYTLTEDPEILQTKGRAYQDGPSQEGQTALFTSFVNMAMRASNVYGSRENPTDSGGQISKEDVDLEHGCIYNTALKFFNTPLPSFDLLRGAQALQVQKQGESGQLATSVVNRDDSRKTAAEMGLAEELSDEQSSLGITNLATWLQKTYNYAWAIIQNRAMRDRIPFCLENGQNNKVLVGAKYTLLPAGDSEVLKRAERLKIKLQLWPIMANTPAAGMFLMDILNEALPEDASKYNQVLIQDSANQKLIAQIIPVLEAIASENRPLNPQEKQMLLSLVQAAKGSNQPQQQQQQPQAA